MKDFYFLLCLAALFSLFEPYLYLWCIKYYSQFHTTWKISKGVLFPTISVINVIVKELLLIVLNSEYAVGLYAAAPQSLNYKFS